MSNAFIFLNIVFIVNYAIKYRMHRFMQRLGLAYLKKKYEYIKNRVYLALLR
jgi:transposase